MHERNWVVFGVGGSGLEVLRCLAEKISGDWNGYDSLLPFEPDGAPCSLVGLDTHGGAVSRLHAYLEAVGIRGRSRVLTITDRPDDYKAGGVGGDPQKAEKVWKAWLSEKGQAALSECMGSAGNALVVGYGGGGTGGYTLGALTAFLRNATAKGTVKKLVCVVLKTSKDVAPDRAARSVEQLRSLLTQAHTPDVCIVLDKRYLHPTTEIEWAAKVVMELVFSDLFWKPLGTSGGGLAASTLFDRLLGEPSSGSCPELWIPVCGEVPLPMKTFPRERTLELHALGAPRECVGNGIQETGSPYEVGSGKHHLLLLMHEAYLGQLARKVAFRDIFPRVILRFLDSGRSEVVLGPILPCPYPIRDRVAGFMGLVRVNWQEFMRKVQ